MNVVPPYDARQGGGRITTPTCPTPVVTMFEDDDFDRSEGGERRRDQSKRAAQTQELFPKSVI
jgi:hypothetical protein